MKLQLIIATLLCLSGITLLFLGFWIPPQGEIDPSVLVAFGWLLLAKPLLLQVLYSGWIININANQLTIEN